MNLTCEQREFPTIRTHLIAFYAVHAYYMSKTKTYSLFIRVDFCHKSILLTTMVGHAFAHKRTLSFSPNGVQFIKNFMCVARERKRKREKITVISHEHMNNANARVQFKCNWSACPILCVCFCVCTAETQSAPWNLSDMAMERKADIFQN